MAKTPPLTFDDRTFQRKLKRIETSKRQATAQRVVEKVGKSVLKRSQKLTPVDEGDVRGSTNVRRNEQVREHQETDPPAGAPGTLGGLARSRLPCSWCGARCRERDLYIRPPVGCPITVPRTEAKFTAELAPQIAVTLVVWPACRISRI